MGKKEHQNRLAKNKDGEFMLENRVAIDDNLLPCAEELEKLKAIDPTIIDWMKERTAIEQNARIKFNDDRVKLTQYDLKKTHGFNSLAIVFAFLLFLVTLILSGMFVYKGMSVEGTIFGGVAILGGISLFIKAANSNKKK